MVVRGTTFGGPMTNGMDAADPVKSVASADKWDGCGQSGDERVPVVVR